MKKLALYLVVGAALLGCGDDDNDSNPNSNFSGPLESGYYSGKATEGSDSEVLDGLVDDEGRLWFTYAEVIDQQENVIGFVSSNDPILLNNGKFATQGKEHSHEDYDSSGVGYVTSDIEIAGNYKSNTLSGKFSDLSSYTINFELNRSTSSEFKRHTIDLITNETITGPLIVSGIGETEATLSITTDGNFTGTATNGCTMMGNFTPVASERYYVSSITFSVDNCADAGGETFKGVSVLDYDDVDDEVDGLLINATSDNEGRGMYFGS